MRNSGKKIFNVFFRKKPTSLLLDLYNANGKTYASNLAKQIDCTYSHVVSILQDMEKSELVHSEKTGRLKLLTLTEKGKKIAEIIDHTRNEVL